jgi:hypothetical protein
LPISGREVDGGCVDVYDDGTEVALLLVTVVLVAVTAAEEEGVVTLCAELVVTILVAATVVVVVEVVVVVVVVDVAGNIVVAVAIPLVRKESGVIRFAICSIMGCSKYVVVRFGKYQI